MAFYNNPYPATYNNAYQPYVPSVQYSQTPQDTGIIWVQGESGAKAFPVQNGKSVVLFDSESEHFFIKTTDMSGMPQPLRIFSYKEANEVDIKSTVDTSNFITREEFEEAIDKLTKTYQRKEGTKNVKSTLSRTDE